MDFDDLISRYIDGELDSQAEAELHHRLSVSPEARSGLRSHTALREASRDTRILDTPSPELHAALFNRLQQEEGMARAAAAVVVPVEALAPVRRDPIPSEMHNPGRRVRRRKTALWFALPMVLIATILASEFLLVEGDETRKFTESVQRSVSQPPSISKAPSELAPAPSAASSDKADQPVADVGAVSTTSHLASSSGPSGSSSMAELKDVGGASVETPTPSVVSQPAPVVALSNSGSGARSLPRTVTRSAAPTDDATFDRLADGDEESALESRMNRGGLIAAARNVDRSRSSGSPISTMSSIDDARADTTTFSLRAAPRSAANEGRVQSLTEREIVQEATNAPPPIQAQTDLFGANQNYRANSNQMSSPSVTAMQRSVTLADSTIESLVRKDTSMRRVVPKAAAKKAKNFKNRASRRSFR